MTRKHRIAVVTPLFPIRDEPYRGKPILETVLALHRLAEIEVFCPLSVYPEVSWLRPKSYVYRRADPTYQPHGLVTHYVEYPTVPVLGRLLNGWSSGRSVAPLLARFKPDLILSYWLYPDGFGAVNCGKNLGVPVVVGSRGSDLLKIADSVTLRNTQHTIRQANHVLTVSTELRQKAIELGADPSRVTTILNGCDTSVFRPTDAAEARHALAIDPSAPLIVFVGHLIPGKGVRELVQAAETLAPRYANLTVALVGEGSLEAELHRDARSVSFRLLLPGAANSPQIARWLAAANLLCLPSYSEGCPNVVLEALACGCPVVASSVGAIPDLITSSSGRMAPPGDAAALAIALEEVLAREWDKSAISATFQRSWDDAAADTYAACTRLLE